MDVLIDIAGIGALGTIAAIATVAASAINVDEFEAIKQPKEQIVLGSEKPVARVPRVEGTFQEKEDATIINDAGELNKDFEAAKLGISKDAYLILIKLQKANKPLTARDVVRARPFGRNDAPTAKIKYYLEELVLAKLATVLDGTYLPVERG